MDQHTAVGQSGIVSKIFSADWQAGFPGIAGNAEIDSIGGSDQRAKDRLSKVTKGQLRRFDLSKADSPWPESPPNCFLISLTLFLNPSCTVSLGHIRPTPPALFDNLLLQIHTGRQTSSMVHSSDRNYGWRYSARPATKSIP